MQNIVLEQSLFQGAVSLEPVEGGWKPWRIPYKQLVLFPPDGIGGRASNSAGVRLRFASDTTSVRLELAPPGVQTQVDLIAEDGSVLTRELEPEQTTVLFEALPARGKLIELYLPQKADTVVKSLSIDDGAAWSIPEVARPKWIAYGSSITQCNAAFSPAQTWPAIVARRFGLDLTCLGYSGNCHIEPMVARMIRDLPADAISLCLGINVYGSGSLNKRSFQAAAIGFVQIVREKHPDTPIALMSPIWSPPRENTKNAVGFTLDEMRTELEEAVAAMTALGDKHLHYINGLDVFDETLAEQLPDNLHPNGPGYVTMGNRYADRVMGPLLARYGLDRGLAANGADVRSDA